MTWYVLLDDASAAGALCLPEAADDAVVGTRWLSAASAPTHATRRPSAVGNRSCRRV
jgi:hypothetical protein